MLASVAADKHIRMWKIEDSGENGEQIMEKNVFIEKFEKKIFFTEFLLKMFFFHFFSKNSWIEIF